MTAPARTLALLALMATGSAHAQVSVQTPFDSVVRRHYYERLEKRPLRAFGYELLFPGAGSYYTGVYPPAACTLLFSLAGAGMWIAGARRDQSTVRWTGVGVFSGARAFGLVSAPVGAMLLNAAFRRQLGLTKAF
jgi:hypothetical protein